MMSPSSTANDVSPLSLRNDVASLRSAVMRCLPLMSRRTHHARRAHHCRKATSFARKGKHHFEPWMGERKRPDLAFFVMSPSTTANDVSPLTLRRDVAPLRSAVMRCLPLMSRRTHHARRAHHCRKATSFARKGKHHFEPRMGERKKAPKRLFLSPQTGL